MKFGNTGTDGLRSRVHVPVGLDAILRRILISIAMIALMAAASDRAVAQNYATMTGAPSFSAPEPVELGFVENANGNLHLEFPLGSFPQRGSSQPYSLRLVYDSHIWQIFTGSGSSWGSSGSTIANGWTYSGITLGTFLRSGPCVARMRSGFFLD